MTHDTTKRAPAQRLSRLLELHSEHPDCFCSPDLKEMTEVMPPPVRKGEGATAAWARDYDRPLKNAGFSEVAENGPSGSYPPNKYAPQKGDVVIIQPIPGQRPMGHMAMYDGQRWVSDFRQERQIWPNSVYQKSGANYKIYRHNNQI